MRTYVFQVGDRVRHCDHEPLATVIEVDPLGNGGSDTRIDFDEEPDHGPQFGYVAFNHNLTLAGPRRFHVASPVFLGATQ